MRRYWVRLWICVAVGLGGSGSRSGAATFTVEGTVAQVRQRNPDLVAARMAIAEARGRRRQAGRFANPELETAVYPNVAGREGFLTFELNQRLPLTGRLRLEKTISETQIRVAEAEVAELERTLAGSAAVAAVEWGVLEREQALRERQVANSRELRDGATRVAAAAEGSSIEADQFAVEAEQLEIQRLQLDAERAAVEGRLRPLLGLPASEPLRIELEPLDPAQLPGAAPAAVARSDQRVALERRRSAELSVALARAQRWQDIGIGVVGRASVCRTSRSGCAMRVSWDCKSRCRCRCGIATRVGSRRRRRHSVGRIVRSRPWSCGSDRRLSRLRRRCGLPRPCSAG